MSYETTYTRTNDPTHQKEGPRKSEIVKRFCTPRIEDLPRRGEKNQDGTPKLTRTSWLLWYALPDEWDAIRAGTLELDELTRRAENRERIVFEHGHAHVWHDDGQQTLATDGNGGER